MLGSLQEKIRGKQTVVQMNQVSEILTDGEFTRVPPVDGFNNGSGQMNAVQYTRHGHYRFQEFGQVIQTGFYDMDLMYMTDVLKSDGWVAFTFPTN